MYRLYIEELNKYKPFSWFDYSIPDEDQLSTTRGKDKYLSGVVNICIICNKRKLIKNKNGICNFCKKYDTPHRKMFRRVKFYEEDIVAAMNKQGGSCFDCSSSLERYVFDNGRLYCENCK